MAGGRKVPGGRASQRNCTFPECVLNSIFLFFLFFVFYFSVFYANARMLSAEAFVEKQKMNKKNENKKPMAPRLVNNVRRSLLPFQEKNRECGFKDSTSCEQKK